VRVILIKISSGTGSGNMTAAGMWEGIGLEAIAGPGHPAIPATMTLR